MANQKYKIELTALDKTKKAFGNVKKGLGSVKNAAVGVTKVIGGTAIAFAGAATALSVVAKKSFDFADAIGKVATRTGIATDTVQAFQIAAIESGTTVEIANKSLEKFTRSVGDAQRGLKTQTDIFKDLGVSITDVNGNTKSMDVLLREVSDAFSTLKSQSEKATVAANLFGRAGIQIIDVLDDGGDAFDAYIQKAKDYGILLSEDSIRKSEKFNDTLALISRQFKVATAAVSIAFLPILQDLSERFSTTFKDITTTGGSIEAFGEMVRTKFLDGLKVGIQGFGNFAVEAQKAAIRIDILGLRFRDFGQAIMDFPFFMLVASLQDFVNAGQKLADVLGFASSGAINFADEILNLEEELKNVKNPADDIIAFIDAYIDGLEKGEGANLTFLNSIREMINGIEAEATNIQMPLEVYRSQLNDSEEQTKAFQNATVSAFKGAEDALTDFVMKGKLDFKGFVNALIADMVRLAIRQRIIAPLFNMFGDGTFGMFRDFASPVSANTPPPFVGVMEGGGFTGFGNRTGGLDGKGGFPAILHPNETVIDHHKGQQVAQQAVNVNFSIQATDASGFDEMLTARKNQIVAMISQAMNQKGKVGLI